MFNLQSFSILGITFHTYGLIVGIALVVGLQLIEYRFRQIKKPLFTEQQLWKTIIVVTIFGILGGRFWHVGTDWYLYQGNPLAAFEIWNGGMSILGAVAGGVLGSYVSMKWFSFDQPKKSVLTLFDLVVFGMPISQAIGRFGNFVNQELYGLPTNLPWAIPIDEVHRVSGYETYTHFHPLFLYEAMVTTSFGIGLWWLWYTKSKLLRFGSGNIALVYLLFYSLTRFFLEFIRIEKTLFLQTPLGFNQVVLLVVAFVALRYLVVRNVNNTSKK